MTDRLQRLKDPKLVQWALAYVGAAFALLQGMAGSIATLRIDPVWDPLRNDPRFEALLISPEPKMGTPSHE